jgi:diguanylate cyclase (GGDEF)-like protein
MHAYTEVLPPGQTDPKLLHRLFYVDHCCLMAAAIVALVNVFPGISVQIQEVIPASWLDMRTSSAAITLLAVTSLFLSEETQHKRWRGLGRILSILTVTVAAAAFLTALLGQPGTLARALDVTQVSLRQGSLLFSAASFLLVGITMLLVASDSSRNRALGYIADGTTFLLSSVVLMLVSGFMFRLARAPGSATAGLTSTPALWCLTLLTAVLVFRRAERGILSALWAYGTGSRIARIIAPFMLALPIAGEILRAYLLNKQIIPAQFAGSILISTGTILGFLFLLLGARLINQMQQDIQGASLRDELTGLHSVRGFYLLAEQAFRQSHRFQEPFGVLFVDMDNLKVINDQLGHSAGSVSLVETAKLLEANFRDTDIVGRVGGDEFVVAGQFNRHELEMIVERLREAVVRKNQAAQHRFSISLSMGFAVTEDFVHETLRSLVEQADEAMYEEKKNKKKWQAAEAPPSVVPQ